MVVAVDVGGTAAKVALVDADRTILLHRSIRTGHLRGRPEMVDEIVGVCVEGVRWCHSQLGVAPAAIGLVVPGIVDVTARVGTSSMLLGWTNVPFGELVEVACGMPTAVGHDVRAAAAAEFDLMQGIEDALFVTVGTGIGAAALIGGKIRTGGHGFGGEIAHLIVNPGGPPCPCGKRGCVEVMSSGPAIARAYEAASGTDADAERVAAESRRGNPIASAVWYRSTEMLGVAIAMYAQILDPSVVIIGGGVSSAGELLLAPVRCTLRVQMSLPVQPQVRTAQLGNQAGVSGAARIALALIQDLP